MLPDAQRIAIAEACGWKEVRLYPSYCVNQPWLGGIDPHPKPIAGIIDAETSVERAATPQDYLIPTNIPDYLSDLNAMHEAEKVLTEKQRVDYWINVGRLCRKPTTEPGKTYTTLSECDVMSATAAQRAEAFLRTLNLWTDK